MNVEVIVKKVEFYSMLLEDVSSIGLQEEIQDRIDAGEYGDLRKNEGWTMIHSVDNYDTGEPMKLIENGEQEDDNLYSWCENQSSPLW